ncbi:MAG: pilin protein MshA [Massilia sp.]|jgi:MSHA pilin protein MshA
MNKNFKTTAQGGFTLIELIVVIVILGILAATALPRFTNLSGDARLASLNAARGALSATSAMTHGRWLVDRAATQNVEGVVVAMNALSGYPEIGADNVTGTQVSETNALMQAAGLNEDYVATLENGALRIVPDSLSGAAVTGCFLTYTPADAANEVPTVTVTGDADDCQ